MDLRQSRMPKTDETDLHGVVAPGFDVIATTDVHLHDAVIGDAQQASFLVTVEFDDEQRHAVLGQALPGLDVVQL